MRRVLAIPDDDRADSFNVYTAGYNLFFLFGMGAFWLYRRGGRGFYEFAAGVVVTIAAAVTLDLPYKLSYLSLVLGFALLVAGATKMELAGYIKVPDFLNFIGNASYTIYLTHMSDRGAGAQGRDGVRPLSRRGCPRDISDRAGGDHCAGLPRLRTDRAADHFLAAETSQEITAASSRIRRRCRAIAGRICRCPQHD